MPLVTVIIPTYNSRESLKLTLETLLLQTLTDFEAWVIGDGCTDDSGSTVAAFRDERLKWFNLEKNSGSPGAPRNEGIRRAEGRLIAYLGHDDLWFPQHLPEPTCRSYWWMSPSNWLHTRRMLDTVGSWSTEARIGNDVDFIRRVWAAGAKIQFRPQLSVLKFPAARWRAYALTGDRPQAEYVEAISRDPAGFRLEILHRVAGAASDQRLGVGGSRGRPGRRLRTAIWSALHRYGLNRWPVSALLRRRWRKRAGLNKNDSTDA